MLPAESCDDAWLAAQQAALARVQTGPYADMLGRVEHIGDGIAFVSGLSDAALNELVHFDTGASGFVHTLEADLISVVLLDDAATVEAGASVTRTGSVLEVPVGEGLLGRVIDPLGRPLAADRSTATNL